MFLPTSLIILLVGAMSPLIGYLIDRYSIRLIFVVGILVQGIGAVSVLARADAGAVPRRVAA